MAKNQTPQAPHSPDAERAILGAVLLDNMAFYQTDRLTVDDFYLDGHRRIFRVMCELMDAGRPIDFVTTTEVLTQKKELEISGGLAYVTNLTDGLPRVKNISQYVGIVISLAKRRKLISLASSMIAEAYENVVPVDELLDKSDRELLNISASQAGGPVRISEILPRVNREAAEQWSISEERAAVGYRTGLGEFDEYTGGFRKREVNIISGWTSDGKSILMKQSLIAQVADNVKTLVFSREISKEQLTEDLKTFVANIPPSHSRDKRKMDLFERKTYEDIDRVIKKWPLWIDDDRGLHIDELQHRARKLIRLEGIEIIFIDYLGLINGSGHNSTEKMEDVCAGIWNLADAENVPVVALAQLSRDKDKTKRRPKLQDLKQASRIEQDAHLVAFIYRPETEAGKPTKNDELIIAKHRHGPTGTLWVEFMEDKLYFKTRDVKYE